MDTQQEKIIHIAKRRHKRRVRRHPIRFMIYVLFFAVVITGLISFFMYRDQLSDGLIADLVSRLRFSLGTQDEVHADAFSYDDYMLSRYASFQNGLVLLSGDRLVIYGASGSEKYGVDCDFTQPALLVSDRTVLAYDRGGSSFLLTDNHSTILKNEWDNTIYTACMNQNGAFALVSAKRGYAAVCTVFDDRQRERFKWHSVSFYIIDAALSPSADLLALASGGYEDGRFVGRITLLDTDSEEKPLADIDLPDTMPLGVGFLGEELIYAVTESGALVFDKMGNLLHDWPFEGRPPLAYCAVEDFLILALSDGRDGESMLVLLDDEGPRALETFSGRLLSLSAAGNWVGLLTDGSATVYDGQLKSVGQPPASFDAKALLMRGDGSAMLLESNAAKVFSP